MLTYHDCLVEDFPHLPLETQMYVRYGPTFAEKWPSSSQFGGNVNFLLPPK